MGQGDPQRRHQAGLSLTPIAPPEREPILDVLRGFAILGILLVNMEVMRGSAWLDVMSGTRAGASGWWDSVVRFAIGWLGAGKFLSSLAILFGVGAALMAARSLRAEESPRPLLARRYAWLLPFGIAHMLIFPGDILFLYGATGLAMLPFVRLSARAALCWSAVLFAAYSALDVSVLMSDARAENSLGDVLSTHASQALYLQPLQLVALPWILSLFLFGFAIARAGIAGDLAAHRALLRRGAWLGLALGLPANFALGFGGPLPGWGPISADEPTWLTSWTTIGLTIGAPLLAVGYLCALSLVCLRRGAIDRLAAVGRMALTAYLLQSILALAVFHGLGLYDTLSTASTLLVVAGIWATLLIVCPLWLRHFRMGPMEWLWRALVYGRTTPA